MIQKARGVSLLQELARGQVGTETVPRTRHGIRTAGGLLNFLDHGYDDSSGHYSRTAHMIEVAWSQFPRRRAVKAGQRTKS